MLSVSSGFKLFIPDALARHNKKEKYGEKSIEEEWEIYGDQPSTTETDSFLLTYDPPSYIYKTVLYLTFI